MPMTARGRVGDLYGGGARAPRGRIGPAQLRQLGNALQAVQECVSVACADPERDHPAPNWARSIPDLSDLAQEILATLA